MIKRLFEPRHMLKNETLYGEVPSTKEAYGRVYRLAFPTTVEAVLGGLTGFVDTLMVSAIGIPAVTAVGITGQPRLIILMLFLALNTGVTALIARRKGENDSKKANHILMQSLLISFVLAVIMTIIGIATASPLLRFAGANDEIIGDAVLYYKIVMGATIFSAITMTINAAQRGVGNTKVAMTTNIVANGVNIIFNYLLIGGKLGFPAMGVAGAAWATFLGIFAGFIIAIFSLVKSTFIYFKFEDLKNFDMEIIKSIVNISGNAALEEMSFRIGFFLYNKIVAGLGTVDYGTHIVGMNILSLSSSIGNGLGSSTTALVGQTMGEKRTDLSRLYVKIGQRIAFIISVLLSSLFVFGGKWLMGLFSDDPRVIENGSGILIIMAITAYFINSQVVYSGCLRGAGDVKFVTTIALISVAIVRPILSYLLCYPIGLGLIGAWIGLLVDQIMRGTAVMLRFRGGKWEGIKI